MERNEIMFRLKELDLQDGDILTIAFGNIDPMTAADEVHKIVDCMKEFKKGTEPFKKTLIIPVVGHYSLAKVDEETMNKAGWYRCQD